MIPYLPELQALRYRRARRLALAEVPWYREQWVGTPVGADPAVPMADEVERQAFRFFPIARPLRPDEDAVAPFDAAALLDALGWGIGRVRRCVVVECRACLLDLEWLSRRRRVAFDALIDPPPGLDPGGRQANLRASALARLARAGRAVVIGDREQLKAVTECARPAPGSVWRLVERVDLGEQMARARLLSPMGQAVLAFDRQLGYVGGTAASCGRLHVSWRAYAVRNAAQGLVVTHLRRGRPRLVDVLPSWGGWLRAEPCPLHRSPVLVPRGHSAMNA